MRIEGGGKGKRLACYKRRQSWPCEGWHRKRCPRVCHAYALPVHGSSHALEAPTGQGRGGRPRPPPGGLCWNSGHYNIGSNTRVKRLCREQDSSPYEGTRGRGCMGACMHACLWTVAAKAHYRCSCPPNVDSSPLGGDLMGTSHCTQGLYRGHVPKPFQGSNSRNWAHTC